jgi:hypothetical protein
MPRLLLLGAITSGCASGWGTWRDQVTSYEGQNLDAMIGRLGVPDRHVELPGASPRTAYTWRIQNRANEFVCSATAVASKETGIILRVTDDCPK